MDFNPLEPPIKDSPKNAISGQPASTDGGLKPFGDDGFSFLDIVDMVNPLQHIPVVSTLYRELTGDDIGHVPRMVGGGLFFGPVGLASAAVNVLVEENTGNDIGGHMLALITGDEAGGPVPDSQLAEAPIWANPDAAAPAYQTATFDRPLTDQEVAELKAQGEPFADERRADQAEAGGLGTFETAGGRIDAGLGEVGSVGLVQAEAGLPADTFEARAAAFYAMEARRDQVRDQLAAYRDAGQQGLEVSHRPSEKGAIGRDGGWFTDTMLDSLIRQQERLAENDARETWTVAALQ